MNLLSYYNPNTHFASAYNPEGDYSHGSPQNARLHKIQMEEIANDIVSKAL